MKTGIDISVGYFSANMKVCEEIAPTDFSCQTIWDSNNNLFEINGGLSRMCGNIQVRFLRGKGAVRLPTYQQIVKCLYQKQALLIFIFIN
jgi:hypothetical protein